MEISLVGRAPDPDIFFSQCTQQVDRSALFRSTSRARSTTSVLQRPWSNVWIEVLWETLNLPGVQPAIPMAESARVRLI